MKLVKRNTQKYFLDGDPYQIETSLSICRAYHWTGSYKIGASVMKELNPSQMLAEVFTPKEQIQFEVKLLESILRKGLTECFLQ